MSWSLSDDILRQASRRSYRVLSIYLALWCWVRKVDCVAIPRHELMSYIGKERFRGRRYEMLVADIRRLFPYASKLDFSGQNKFSTLYLSRKKYPNGIFDATMSDERRVEQLHKKGLATGIIKKLPPEMSMVSTLARMAHGLQDFTRKS